MIIFSLILIILFIFLNFEDIATPPEDPPPPPPPIPTEGIVKYRWPEDIVVLNIPENDKTPIQKTKVRFTLYFDHLPKNIEPADLMDEKLINSIQGIVSKAIKATPIPTFKSKEGKFKWKLNLTQRINNELKKKEINGFFVTELQFIKFLIE